MGRAHGRAYAEDIRRMTESRVRLCSDPKWSGHALPRSEVLALAEACLDAHRDYAPQLVAELEGVGEETGLSLPELIILNGFTDFTDTLYRLGGRRPQAAAQSAAQGCTAFIVPDEAAEGGAGFYGQTWDMHHAATPYVILLRVEPENAPPALMFTITGCVGMIGMNAAGIAVGINMLSGTDGRIGVTWPFVIREVLAQREIEAALACITSAELAGAHNYLLFDRSGRGYNVEAMATRSFITEVDAAPYVHTNHCLYAPTLSVERERPPDLLANSEARLASAEAILAKRPVTAADLFALTREPSAICRQAEPPYHVETCGAAVMRPQTGEFWAVWGLPSENEYQLFGI